MARFEMVEMTPAEAAKFLRNLCEMTQANSKNWDNMQAIFERFVGDAYKGGVNRAAKEIEDLGGDNAQFHADGVRRRLLPETIIDHS